MSIAVKQKKIDELLEKANESLGRGSWFEAERMAGKALAMARQEQDFERMIAAITPLREARLRRWHHAIEIGTIVSIDTSITEEMKIEPGCYLVHPPQVGADARRLRLAAFQREIPVAVLCREPLTKLRLLPVVAISPGSTVRVKLPPPEDIMSPPMSWFVDTARALGDWAISSIDPELPVMRRIDALLDRLDAVPEHEGLHHALEEACREAQSLDAINQLTPKPGKSKLKT